ncbi:hypothetical protein B0F90DRAFT_1812923 [Multifurca ochricompacta]|uniref:Uncharacterized protein n=1 Tax=Multifurca ochricompacta TaxID=376703 RepID=A0AAD4QR97_9AGAM|nr:hypothetical protein B0F90DRAFT_1812923 [Multifurca ochricompacta]
MKFIALVSIALATSTFALPLPESGLDLDARAHPGGSKSGGKSFLSEIKGEIGSLTSGKQTVSGSSNHGPISQVPSNQRPPPSKPPKKSGGKTRRAQPSGSENIGRSFLSSIAGKLEGDLTSGPHIKTGSSNPAPIGTLPSSNHRPSIKFGGRLRRALRDVSRDESEVLDARAHPGGSKGGGKSFLSEIKGEIGSLTSGKQTISGSSNHGPISQVPSNQRPPPSKPPKKSGGKTRRALRDVSRDESEVLDARAHPGGSKGGGKSFLSEIKGEIGSLTSGKQTVSGSSNHGPISQVPSNQRPPPSKPPKKSGGKTRRALRDVSRDESD